MYESRGTMLSYPVRKELVGKRFLVIEEATIHRRGRNLHLENLSWKAGYIRACSVKDISDKELQVKFWLWQSHLLADSCKFVVWSCMNPIFVFRVSIIFVKLPASRYYLELEKGTSVVNTLRGCAVGFCNVIYRVDCSVNKLHIV